MKKMKFVISGLLCTLLALSFSSNSYATPSEIVDFESELNEAFRESLSFMPLRDHILSQHKISQEVEVNNVRVEELGSPQISNRDTQYAGKTYLMNNTNTEQTLKSQSIDVQMDQTVSNSVTEGITIGNEIEAGFSLWGLGMNNTLSTEYSFSSTQEKSNTTSTTVSIPSQEITVPANTKLVLTAVYQKVQATGTTELKANLSGNIVMSIKLPIGDMYHPVGNHNIYDVFNATIDSGYELPSTLTLDHQNREVLFSGKGTYTADYGTDLHLQLDYYSIENSAKNSARIASQAQQKETIASEPYKTEVININ
ncbi:ETX/MTX2 family pore-forming toxin [Bacillus carboniphilus]|uniref:ETX/MTX2 family pore-forming toxin n=1 Tax=Bacillus carboniphilus TaxID=86663 RepID=A0ABY9JS89_9BACI|nr:ETX/MTX2 family pore-forming toxin [Bacillus carboniphilus]WLR41603.1 ETX/MTX2 family pore-forming toxin [Bacillus carboniphilus]